MKRPGIVVVIPIVLMVFVVNIRVRWVKVGAVIYTRVTSSVTNTAATSASRVDANRRSAPNDDDDPPDSSDDVNPPDSLDDVVAPDSLDDPSDSSDDDDSLDLLDDDESADFRGTIGAPKTSTSFVNPCIILS